jgi:hypothetical protein
MLAAIAVLLTLGVVLYTLWVRDKDIPAPAPVSPTAHLEERKAAIYENLRDLQFEYRLGKLSEGDYQQTKLDLQKELAAVLAEIDRVTGSRPAPPKSTAPATAPAATAPSAQPGFVCARCGARFPQPMKFCGECGSPMAEAGA